MVKNTSENIKATQGSLLIVKPAYNFNLPTFLSGGSLGQFGLQITLTAINYLSYDVGKSRDGCCCC